MPYFGVQIWRIPIAVGETDVQDWSLQCPSNPIWPFKYIPLSKQPFKIQPQIEDVTWNPQYFSPATRTNKRRALSLQEVELDGWFSILHIILKHVPYNSCTSLIWALYFISIYLDWRFQFEPTLSLKGWNLRALQNEIHMKITNNHKLNTPNIVKILRTTCLATLGAS
jgi:hypothetical protein